MGFPVDEVDRPSDVRRGGVAGLANGFLVVCGLEVLAEMALEANDFGAIEELHG